MENQNKIVESILAKEKAKGATKPKDIKPTQGMSIAEKIVAKEQGTQQQLTDMAARIGANAEAMQGALAHRDYEKTKANTAKMLDESTLGTKPYASSEDVQREQVQTFMDKKAEEARARGMKDYLDSTIGAWSADRVSSIVGGLTDADTERIRRGAERVSQLKQEGETPEVAELSIPRAEVDVQLPKSIAEAKMLIEQERTKGVSKISFSGLADRSKKEASKVVKDYLAENPHMEANAEMLEAYVANNIYNDTFKWKLENDEQFFADAYEATTGKNYAEYKREVDNEARAKLQSMKRELEAMNETLKKKRDENRTNAGQSRSAFSAAWSDLKNAFGGNIEEIDNLIDGIDNVLEGSFSSGFDKGFDFDRMATAGLSGVFTEGEMANALMKANNGEPLTEEEENYVRIHQYAQELDQLKKVREKYAEQMYDKFLGFNLNSIGEGVGTTVEMMPAFAGGMTATGLIGKFADIGGKAALKTALHAGGKELFKYGVKTTGKLGYNFGLAKARGLVAAPFMPSTYNTYLESLNSAYSFDDNGNLTYKPVDKTQSYFGAVFSTANEISSEYLGIGIGKVVGWGARGVGRMAANTKIAETLVEAGKKVRKHLPKLTPQAKVAMRTLGVQADPISETLSEALGDIMTSYEQSMMGMDVDMSQYGTFDYWMTLAGVTLAYGGSIAAMGAVKSYADVRSVVKERDAILGKISNRNLYNTLLAVSTSDDVVLASSALADFDWEGNDISPEDRRLAEAYAVADLNVKIMEGAVEEGSRLDKFRGTIEGVRNIVYQGKAGEYSDKIFEAEVDGKKVFVVNGFEENSTTNLYVVVDAATGEKSSVDKSKVKLTREVDVDTYIQEAYTNAFSLESEKSRVKDVREKALQMDNPTEKDVQRVASTLDITLPKVGDAVMLANGNMGSVTERLSPTEYAVQDLSGATYKVHFTDILSTDKLTATAQGALARGEVSAPMPTTPEVSVAEASAEDVTPDVAEPATDENGITMGSEVTVDGRVGTVRARTENGDYVVSFEDESGNYENAEVEVYTPAEMASLMGVAPMPTATAESTAEGTPTTTEVATTEDGSVDIEQMSAEDAAKVLVERAGTVEEAIAQVKQVIETVTEERKKMAKAEKKVSLNDIGKKSAELQVLDARLEFYGEVLGVLEGMFAEQQKQTMTEAQNIAEEAGVATTEASNDGDEKSAEAPTSGLIRNGAEMKFTDNVIRMVDFIAKRLGITVEFVDGLKNDAGQPINGDIKGKHVRISTKGDRGVKFIVGHEFFHRIKDNVDEVTYNKYVDALKEFFGEERWEEALNAQKRKYRAHNVAVAKKSMEGMTPEEVAAIAQQLGVNIEGLSAEDAKNAVARAAMRKAEQGDEVARALFPTMLTYSDDLMLEETAADISGEMVANLDAFSNFVEDNKSEYAIIRGMHKALRYINDMFASFGQTTRQRKVKRLIKNLESIMAEAVKNEREGVNKARKDAKKNGVQGSDARFSLSSTPIFFSNAQYAVQNIKQEKATPEQWLKMIEKNGGLKAGEDKWLGLSDWLKASDKKTLTKDEVLQYIAENDIQIEEVSYGDVEDSARFKELYIEYNALYYEYGRNSERAFEEMLANYGDDFGIAFEAAGDELWVRDSEAAEVFVDINRVNDTRLQYSTDGLTNKKEIALVVPTIEPWNTSDNIHFGDAGEGRAVAWIRFGETTDADGKRVLVIDEIQSKRHQDGREKGYRDVEAEKREKAERERELTEVVLPRLAELNQLYNEKYGVGKWRDTEYDRQWRPRRVYRFLTPEEQAEHEAIAQRAAELQMPMPRRSGIPSAPFEKNWAELAFKRMLRYAAENGYDYVAWTTGDQQADRYDIGSVVKDIVTYDTKDADGNPIKKMKFRMNNMGTYNIATNMEGVIVKGDGEMKEGMHLSDITGKALAEKIMNGEGEDAMVFENGKDIEAKSLEGEELHIGNEGMKAFYDQMLPSFVKKYTKKWGAEVGEVTMPVLEENNTMHAVNVTDSMRESVMQGQPKFSLPSLVGVHNLSLDKLRKVIKMGGLANPSVAVIDVDKQTHVDYGEYSLILPKNMVDARQGKNAGTWAGDAWTPTYPQVVKRMNDDKAISRFYKDIDALPEAMRSRVRLDFDSFMDGRSANALAYWYLFEKGNAPEMVLVPSRYSNDVTHAVSEATKGSFSMFNLTPEERAKCLDAYIAVKFDGDRAAFEAEMQARIERLAETIETKKSDRVKKWAQDTIDSIKEYGFDYDDVADFIRDVGYDVKEKGEVNVDATIMAAQERINESNLAAEYDAWRNNLDERYGIDEFIFDGYTNSGNRRYLPHTVENASKWMKKQGRQGAVATFPSFGTFVAVSIPKMTTLESIRKRKALLGKSKEEYDAFREKWENVYYELGKKLQPDAKSFEDYGYWRLIEAVGQKNPKEFIKKQYGVELSEEDMTQLNEMLNAIRTEYPARYFETKFERPLQLSDFTAAVVPNDIPLDVESRLKDANVEVIEYEKGDNASRAEAMQKASQMENVRFSLQEALITPEMDTAYLDAVNRGDMATAQKMVMETAKLAMPNTKVVNEDGNPKVVYHGTPNNFNAFSKEMFGTSTDRGIWGNGFYFSDSEQYAKTYEKRGDKQGRTLTVFLNIENPLFISLRNGGNEGAMYFHELMEKHFTDDIYEDATRTDELMSVAQERLTADIVAKGYDGIVVEYTNHIDTEYVAFEPNQIKSADPVTYDDAGNIIPLSERFNPRKEDIRYSISSEEDARFERKVAFLTDLVREYNIPLPTFIAQTKEEFVRMVQDNFDLTDDEVEVNRAEIERMEGAYVPEDEIVLINGEVIRGREQMSGCVRHEFGHYITKKHLLNDIRQAANTLGEDALKRAQQEFLRGYRYKELGAEGVVNELVSYLSETPTIQEIMSIFEGNLEVDEFIKKLQAQLEARNDLKEKALYIALLPLAKKNIELQKKQYGSEKENTIVIPRKDSSGRGNSKSEGGSSPSYSKGFSGTQARSAAYDRRSEGTDAQEVTRFMLPDPDPSEVFYDEIPIFDEQGNEIDITTLFSEEAQAILDSKVRQMLEAEYEHNISAIRKEAREARQAIIDRYYEEKNKRKKNNKPSRTNAARIDDILGDKPFESLPYEDQALILIATGQAKIRWSDKGAQRGLASELGLKGSKGDKHAYRSIWSGATKSFNEVVHDWWESIGGQERGIDDQDLRNALIEAFQSVQSSKDAMGEIIRKYDDLLAERDAALAEADRMEEKDLREAKAAYEHHYANFELSEGEERASYHDRAAQFFGNQNLSRTDEILEDLVSEMERQKRKIERLKAENKDIYAPLAEGIQKSKDIVLRALERLRMFAGMEEVDLNDVARIINLVKTARSRRQMNNLSAQATALVQRVSIKKAKTNLMRLLSLKLSNTDIIHKMLAESDKWTKEERDAILKHLWKVSRNGLRVSKAVHRDTKEIFDELKRLVDEFRKEKLKGLDNEQKALVIDAKLAKLEQELHPEVVYDSKGNVLENYNLPTDFNAENKHLAKYLFKTYLEMLAAEAKYRNASKVLSEKIENKEQTGNAYADVVAIREDYLHALTQLNSTLEHLILKGKDELRDWNAQKEKHEIEIRRMGIEAIGGEKAGSQGKRSKWGARQRALWNISFNSPYWTFETVLEKIDHKTPYKRGKFFSYFMDKWSDANDDLIMRYMAHFEQLGEAMSKCFPNDATFMKMKRNPYRMFQYIMRKAESTPIGTITYKEDDSERQMVLNVANAMYIIAMWRQPRYQEAMKERGITQQDVDTLMQSIASKDAGFIDFMDWVNEKFLPSTRLEYDVVFRKMNGGSMPKEVNYFPARVAAHQEVDLTKIENGAMPTTPTALKDRTSHNIMPEMGMDYFKVLEAHIEDMDKWAAYAELTADLNVLLSSDEFRRRLNEYMGGLGGDGGGKGSLYELFKQTSLIATGLYRGDAGMQAFFGHLQKAWATSNIAFRGWTALKQISSVTTGMFDNVRFYKHALKAASIVGIYSEIRDAMEVSPSLRQRWKSGAAGMEALAREAQRADGYTVHRGAYEKSRDAVGDAIKLLVRAGMTPNAAVDLLSCSIIVNSVYETEIARLTGGKREATEEEKRAAVRKAERAFNTTQQSSEGAYLAPVQANPTFGVLTTYMNASFALHRKRMAGVKELWKLMTSKEYRRFIKDEYGEDAAKMSAVDAMKDIMSGIAGELSFAAMGWGLMEFMSWVNSWFNDDDDDDDTAAAKAEFADTWWQSFLNGYLLGSLVTSIKQGFDTSLTPAYDEFISDAKGIFDDKGDAVNEVAQVVAKYGLGVDLKALYKAGVGIRNLFEDDERVGAILMLLNAPERYVKAFVGDRREDETMEEYQTRIVRFYTLFDDVKYSDYFDENGKYIGEDAPSIIMSKTKAQELRKEYEAAYRKDVLHHYGGKEAYASYMDTEKMYKDICELLGWKAEAKPSKEKSRLSDLHRELAYEQKQVAKKAEKRKNWVGGEEEYYDKLVDEQKAKDELINQYYEYIKQSGLGAY